MKRRKRKPSFHISKNHLLIFFIGLCFFSAASWSLKAPHNGDISCDDCHGAEGEASAPIVARTAEEQETLCRSCHYKDGPASSREGLYQFALHSVESAGEQIIIRCGACHDPHGSTETTDPHTGQIGNNLFLIRSNTNDYVSQAVGSAIYQADQNPQGTNTFVFNEVPFSGICQNCHQNTNHWRNNELENPPHNYGMECTTCHKHKNGFQHGGGSGGTECDTCHGHDPGYEYEPGLFSQGTGSTHTHSTHTENDSDDQKGPNVQCSQCHDTNSFPYFKSGTDADGNSYITLPETDVCDDCHSQNGYVDGVTLAKNNWHTGIYEEDGKRLKAGNEFWCASCHDETPANSKQDETGVLAPNITGDNLTYGYYFSGHGEKVSCTECHDPGLPHIDHEHRTYELDEDTGAVNSYGYSYRLRGINGGLPLRIPREPPLGSWDPRTADDFRLCLSCHDMNKIMGYDSLDVTWTNFWNDPSQPDQDWTYGSSGVNNHYYHLAMKHPYDSDWDSTKESPVSCVTCHNPHGSPSYRMIRYGKLISTPGTTDREPGFNFNYLDGVYEPNSSIILENSTGAEMHDADGSICFWCHEHLTRYYRIPNLTPRVINATADRSSVIVEGENEMVLLTCDIIDPDNNMGNVVIDLSAIGGSAVQPMFDDGSNGDVTANDGRHSFMATVPTTTGSALKALPITATDLNSNSDNIRQIDLPVLVLDAGNIQWDNGVDHELELPLDIDQDGNTSNDPDIGIDILTIRSGEIISIRDDLIIGNSLTVQSSGELILLGSTYDINLDGGGTLAIPYGSGPTITASTITIESGGSINADAQGFPVGEGPGVGTWTGHTGASNESGGGYAGEGGACIGSCPGGSAYGTSEHPTALGSGAGHATYDISGDGGGAIKLVVSGAITVNGVLSANGGSGATSGGHHGGGGSGGSIWIASGALTGNGEINAMGGNAGTWGGAGSGGRIDISDTTNQFTGSLNTAGGTSAYRLGDTGTIIFDENYWDNATVSSQLTWGEALTVDSLTIADGGSLTLNSDLIVNQTLTVESGGELVLLCDSTTGVTIPIGDPDGVPGGSGPTITATDILIEANASINADAQGFKRNGLMVVSGNAGGGYGGIGGNDNSGNSGGITYGTVEEPTVLGTAGSNASGQYAIPGAGGGAIKIVASGTITVNGSLSVNGGDGYYTGGNDAGGGSGGSLWIASGTLTGDGLISATGGSGNRNDLAGAGGGGRIDIYGTSYDFYGTITAAGGTSGYAAGGTGSIRLPESFWDVGIVTADMVIGGVVNVPGDLLIRNGATLTTGQDMIIGGHLYLGNPVDPDDHGNMILTGDTSAVNGGTADDPFGSGPTISADSITIFAGSTMDADGQGFGRGQGPAGGGNAGGSYGGVGGRGSGGSYGSTYGSMAGPSALGSGGGSRDGGGTGGGAIKLTVANTITVDGLLSADGQDAAYCCGTDGGGASGGSIWISSGTLTGIGTISTRGGKGMRSNVGGAGGGGRIDVYGTTYHFAGTITAAGGNDSYERGATGTVLIPDAFWTNGIIDHHISMSNDVIVPGSMTIRNDAVFKTAGDLTIGGDLYVGDPIDIDDHGTLVLEGDLHTINEAAGGTVILPYGSGPLIDAANVYIYAGSSMNADGTGFHKTYGPGSGSGAAGGSYGGIGGNGVASYGDPAMPLALGSAGGGSRYTYESPGTGGGAIKIETNGVLHVDGVLSANGNDGKYCCGDDAGGGSGGSIWGLCNTLSGTGIIEAAGGNGYRSGIGAGGGGGRIAISCTSDNSQIVPNTIGGIGVVNGEAGSVE